jgi:serine/threonine protein kinase
MIGRMLRQYLILERVGEGGMGVVWKARDTSLDRDVALKVLPPDEYGTAGRKERFMREAKAASTIGHPAVVEVLDAGQTDEGQVYMVLELLEGEDFEDLVRRNPEVGVKTIRRLSQRLLTCEDRLSDLARKEVPARLASLILGLSEHQGIMMADSGCVIPTRYTHNRLASMVGSNREAVTRAFRKLRDAGAVEIRDRRIYVTEADSLERLANAER